MADEENVGGMKMKRSPEEQFKRALKWNTKQSDETLIKFASLAKTAGLMTGEMNIEFYGYITSKKKGDRTKAVRLITEVARETQPKIGAKQDEGAIGSNTLAKLEEYNEKNNPVTMLAMGGANTIRRETLAMIPKLIVSKKPKIELAEQKPITPAKTKEITATTKGERYEGNITITFDTKNIFEIHGKFTEQELNKLMYSSTGPDLLKRKLNNGEITLENVKIRGDNSLNETKNKELFFMELRGVKDEVQGYQIGKSLKKL